MMLIFTPFNIIAVISSITFFSISFFRSNKKTKAALFLRLSKEGTLHNLTFCSQEILQNKVIGIDGIHRKIMVVEKLKKNYKCDVISLDDVNNCEVVTTTGISQTGIKRYEIENNLHAVALQFEFKNDAQPASIVFYNCLMNSKNELLLLKAKATYWNVMLSKMLNGSVSAHA